VTFAIPYPFFLLAEMFSTFSLQKSSSNRKKEVLQNFRFATAPTCYLWCRWPDLNRHGIGVVKIGSVHKRRKVCAVIGRQASIEAVAAGSVGNVVNSKSYPYFPQT